MEIMKHEGFDKCLIELSRRGGPYQRAADQVFNILGRLQSDPNALSKVPTTNYGESRIKKAVKYDLSGYCRLITIQDSGHVFFCFLGDHNQCDLWLERNKGMVVKTLKGKKPVVMFKSLDIDEVSGRLDRRAGLSPKKLLDLLTETRQEELMVGLGKFVRKAIAAMDTSVSDDELLEVIDEASTERHRAALFDTLVHLRAGDSTQADRCVMALTGEISDIPSDSDPDVTLVDSEDFKHVPVDSEHYRRLIQHYAVHADYRDWMLFMHPEQQRYVDEDYAGPAKLSGVSGSGKTCIVVNRAVSLAKRYNNERILILTLNKSLASLIHSLVKKAALDELRDRIDVRPFFGVCQDFLREFEPSNGKLYDESTWKSGEHIDEIWREFYRCELNNRGAAILHRLHDSLICRGIDAESYVREEFDWIRSATTPDRRDEYLTMERVGRAYPLDRAFRKELLAALSHWESKMRLIGVTDYLGLANAAYKHIDQIKPIYRCVLVDESQDFGTVELQLVKKLLRNYDGEGASNSIFLCGDAAQRVSSKHQNLGEAGMLVPGSRSFTLALNYRNSREILSLSHSMLAHNLTDEMMGSKDFQILDPRFANFSGPAPLLLSADNLGLEIQYALEYALQEANHNSNTKICIAICGYTQHELAIFARKLQLPILDGTIDLGVGNIFLSDLENTKGFEFQCMIILNAEARVLPYVHSPEQERFRDLSRLYVAMTRARQQLIISYSGSPSSFLKNNQDDFLEDRWDAYIERDSLPSDCPYPSRMEQLRSESPSGSLFREMTGEQFLYRDEAIGLPPLLVQRVRDLFSGKSVVRNGAAAEWPTLGSALKDFSRSPRSRQAFGPEALNHFREHLSPLLMEEIRDPRRPLSLRDGSTPAV